MIATSVLLKDAPTMQLIERERVRSGAVTAAAAARALIHRAAALTEANRDHASPAPEHAEAAAQ